MGASAAVTLIVTPSFLRLLFGVGAVMCWSAPFYHVVGPLLHIQKTFALSLLADVIQKEVVNFWIFTKANEAFALCHLSKLLEIVLHQLPRVVLQQYHT